MAIEWVFVEDNHIVMDAEIDNELSLMEKGMNDDNDDNDDNGDYDDNDDNMVLNDAESDVDFN